MIKELIDVVLTVASLKSLELNNSEARTEEQKAKKAEQRKMISNVRNVAWIIRRAVS